MMKKMVTMSLILICVLLSAPPNSSGVIFRNEGINPYEPLWQAVSRVESNFDPLAIGDKNLKEWSYGVGQIRQVRLDDYFKQTGIRYSTDDMFCPGNSRKVFMHYASQRPPHEMEAISREWNGGPDWKRKKQTQNYWWKVEKWYDLYKNLSKS